ncbi:MAG TPA: RNA polymerase sigma factor [Polyangiaceae bacterium]|nr:RNA polymerase sigma factor [Polyangiaceae bacterium]
MTDTRDALAASYRNEARRVLATLIRLLGGFDAAEEAVHEAFAAAAEQWPRQGVPANPYAWLVSTGRFKIIDRIRRQARLTSALPELAGLASADEQAGTLPEVIDDDELRLIFTCCHPALAPDARVALTLREVGGLTTEEIARAYLVSTPTIAQRIVRAKAKIRDERIPYELPARAQLATRLESALQVVYLIFNEGYAASLGPRLTRDDLCLEAVRLARLIVQLLPEPEALGLLSLMLLHEARRSTRVDGAGDLVLLENQDRTRWNGTLIREAQELIERALTKRSIGPYLLQAAIVAVHAEATSYADTDWAQIVGLYDVLKRVDPSPVVALNRAVALGMRDDPGTGLRAIEALLADGALAEYHLAHAARADLQRRVGLLDAARESYERALQLARQPAERRFLEARLAELGR